jgi:hypothetical protein
MKTFKTEFVEYVPDKLDEGVLYISIAFRTVSHNCACGCGLEVVTPISPTDWQLTYDGRTVTLFPSIGNWNYPCRSHYWIKRNEAVEAPTWSREEINAGRRADQRRKNEYFDSGSDAAIDEETTVDTSRPTNKSILARIRSWLGL